eukprot:gene10947-3653_t
MSDMYYYDLDSQDKYEYEDKETEKKIKIKKEEKKQTTLSSFMKKSNTKNEKRSTAKKTVSKKPKKEPRKRTLILQKESDDDSDDSLDGFIVSDIEEDQEPRHNSESDSDSSIQLGSDSSGGHPLISSSDTSSGEDTDEDVVKPKRKIQTKRKTRAKSSSKSDSEEEDSDEEMFTDKNTLDFLDEEDSEDEIVIPKKLKRKKVVNDDIENFSSSEEEKKPKKKKIEIDSDEEKEALFGLNPNRKGSILDFMKSKKVDRESLNKRRDAHKFYEEKQKNIKKNLKSVPKADRLVNVAKDEDDEPVYFQPELFSILKPHQIEGIRFMWDHIITPKKKSLKGCILAHSMGLGKTLQVCSFTELAFRSKNVKTILILCPKSVVENWDIEYKKWSLKTDLSRLSTYPINDSVTKVDQRLSQMKRWTKQGGVLIISFNLFSIFANSTAKKDLEKNQKCKELLLNADLVVADEGHKIKNDKGSLYKATMKLKTSSRIILTGTPLQNNLNEYWTMSSFVRPIWEKKEFKELFTDPINDGQSKDASTYEINRMKRRSFLLTEQMKQFVHRKDQSILKTDLPSKHEYVVYVPLTEYQKKLYQSFLEAINEEVGDDGRKNILQLVSWLSKIETHPDMVKRIMQRKGVSQSSFNSSITSGSAIEITSDDDENSLTPGIKSLDDELETIDLNVPLEWASPVFDKSYKERDINLSSKMKVLFKIIEKCIEKNEKILVFSQYTSTLDLMEDLIATRKFNSQNLRKVVDEKTPARMLSKDDLNLYDFEQNQKRLEENKVNYDVIKDDKLMIEVATEMGIGINRILEHESLFIDDAHDKISEAEKASAKIEYEDAKRFSQNHLLNSSLNSNMTKTKNDFVMGGKYQGMSLDEIKAQVNSMRPSQPTSSVDYHMNNLSNSLHQPKVEYQKFGRFVQNKYQFQPQVKQNFQNKMEENFKVQQEIDPAYLKKLEEEERKRKAQRMQTDDIDLEYLKKLQEKEKKSSGFSFGTAFSDLSKHQLKSSPSLPSSSSTVEEKKSDNIDVIEID